MRCEQCNLILIIIDALRYDRLNHVTAPFLTKFAKQSIVFENAYSVTNATDPSITSMLTALYPLSHGIIEHGEKVKPEHLLYLPFIEFLQEILRNHGYITIAIDFLGRWHKRGFDMYLEPETFYKRIQRKIIEHMPLKLKFHIKRTLRSRILATPMKRKLMQPYDASKATNFAIEILRRTMKKNKKFFMLIHYWDVHIPYNAPSVFIRKLAKVSYNDDDRTIRDLAKEIKGPWYNKLRDIFGENSKIRTILALYDASVAYVDQQVRRIIEFLEENKLLDRTVLVITSDHGESLGEHSIWFDHHGLYEVNIHVPLILHIPGIAGRKIKSFVQHVDLVPTLLEILRLKHNIVCDGIRLPIINESYVRAYIYAEESYVERKFAIRVGKYKYITALKPQNAFCRYCHKIHGGIEELYNLSKDPGEEINIINSEPDVAKELRFKLLNLINNMIKFRILRRIKSIREKLKSNDTT